MSRKLHKLTMNKIKDKRLWIPAFYHLLSSASCKLTSGAFSHISVRSGSITHGSIAILNPPSIPSAIARG